MWRWLLTNQKGPRKGPAIEDTNMSITEIPNLPTEKLIEIAEFYEMRAKQYSAPALKSECSHVAGLCRAEIAKR